MIQRLLLILIVLAAPVMNAQVLFPKKLEFGTMAVGTVYAKTLTIINTTAKTIYPMYGSCTGYGEFNVESKLPDSIMAGDTAEFVLKIRPTSISPLDMGCGIINHFDKPGNEWSVGYSM